MGTYIDNDNNDADLKWIDNTNHYKNNGGIKYRLYDVPLSGHTYSSVWANDAIPGKDPHGDARIKKYYWSILVCGWKELKRHKMN